MTDVMRVRAAEKVAPSVFTLLDLSTPRYPPALSAFLSPSLPHARSRSDPALFPAPALCHSAVPA
eukprot:1349477-Pleurochrysis_carterae.AAC.1